MFNNKSEEMSQSTPERVPKVLDSSKTAFLTQTSQSETPKTTPGQLNMSQMAQFNNNSNDNDIRVTKNMDETKKVFLEHETRQEEERIVPGQLDQSKLSQFSKESSNREYDQASEVEYIY